MFRSSVVFILFATVIFVLQRETVAQGSPLCPVNTSYQLCGRLCEPSCDNPNPVCPMLQCSRYTASCKCLDGYLRDKATDECVDPSQCPSS